MSIPEKSSRYLPGLTGLRGWAALLVFLYHWRGTQQIAEHGSLGSSLANALDAFDFGVCLFFVLSGFLLSRPIWREIFAGRGLSAINWQKYLIRRMTRILPAYYLVVICFFLFEPQSYTLKGLGAVLTHFLCLHTFFDDYYAIKNPVLWTIGIEFQFYLLLPLLMWCASWGFRLARVSGAIVSLCAAVGLLEVIYGFGARTIFSELSGGMLNWAENGAAIERSVFYFLKWFLPGILAACMHERLFAESPDRVSQTDEQYRRNRRIWDLVFLGAVCGIVVLLSFSAEAQWRSISRWGWPLNVAIVAVLISSIPHSRLGTGFLENWWTIFFGEISYGLYLWHYPLLKAIAGGVSPRLQSSPDFMLWSLLAAGLLSVFLATFSYLFVERPTIRKGHQINSFRSLLRECRQMF